ncbi:pilus assembly PilX family protein [Polaromonas eurypsychrophila]|nr:hypothetical protein [Polaromonas eurypsychrophila]
MRHHRQSGISLIVVMIMVVIIGLTSAAAIRNATSGERATNNIRLQSQAQQYAEAALRYCESEVTKANDTRVATLRNANIVQTAFGAPQAGWEDPATWTGAGLASASRTTLPIAQIKSDDSSVTPATRPQCVAERQILADGGLVMVITARGFSPGYTANANGITTGGSVVWLQSISYLE